MNYERPKGRNDTLVRTEYASHIIEQCLHAALGGASFLDAVKEEIVANFEQRMCERSEENVPTIGITMVLRDVFDTRMKQLEMYDAAHDDTHTDSELVRYACCLAYPEPLMKNINGNISMAIPMETDDSTPENIVLRPWKDIPAKDPDRRDVLIKSIGLMVAEVERIDRARVVDATNKRAFEAISADHKARAKRRKAKKKKGRK